MDRNQSFDCLGANPLVAEQAADAPVHGKGLLQAGHKGPVVLQALPVGDCGSLVLLVAAPLLEGISL